MAMSKELVIVESPTKARTLTRFLGDSFQIEASMGHVRDLPKAKRKAVEHLRDLIRNAKSVILATDPDREGEAIAWHVGKLAENGKKKVEDLKRIVFHEITKEAVEEALKKPRTIDLKLVDAQVARRVLDRLVGYKLSPLLWKKVKSGLSAGRVQSVAVRLIVEREREIAQFKPVEYWSIEALLQSQKEKGKNQNGEFLASLTQKDGKKIEVKKEKEASGIVKDLEDPGITWVVSKKEEKELRKSPGPPFTTSTMTQAAANSFGYTAKKTMKLAQDLYEEGLITYHRTDSVNLSPIALVASRKFIEKEYGKEYLPPASRIFKTKSRLAQEAHEAIRPAKVEIGTDTVQLTPDHKKLYQIIWNRFVASQMAEAIYDQVTLAVTASREQRVESSYLFRASGSLVKFPGYLKVYGRSQGDVTGDEDKRIPVLSEGTQLALKKLLPEQHFTEAPPRYTEASLIKTLEEMGIGRPSTYAPIISTIQERNYVELEERKFRPTPIGVAVNDFLIKNFSGIVDYTFTASMEDQLDDIANGEKKWVPIISEFYGPFAKELDKVEEESDRVKIFAELTSEKCPEGHPLVIKYGRFGKFLACENFPEHKYTKAFEEKIDSKCPESGDPIVIKRTRRGRPFYGCSGYPKCKWMSWRLPKEAASPAEKPQTN